MSNHPSPGPSRTAQGSRFGKDGKAHAVVGIGASAGGLEAISRLLRHLPDDLGMAYVVVQHLDPSHESSLAALLARVSPMPVREATEAITLAPDHVYVIPPNTSMVWQQGVLHLTPRADTREARRPVDLFFRTLAEGLGGRSIGVVLSGTGTDGTPGLQAIRAEGGLTFAQDATATYGGMPTSAVTAGCVDYVLPPEAIAEELARISDHLSAHGTTLAGAKPTPNPDGQANLDAVVLRLSEVSGVDFSNYKKATIRRRIQRRMVINRIERLAEYQAILDSNPGEAETLCRDVLINVTSFFRDTAVFEALGRLVFPALLNKRPAGLPIRIWVPGCSTGEEAYSLAITLLEQLGPRSEAFPIKIFGTDVSESVINQARSGRYPEGIAADVAPERLRRFFTKEESGYVISKAVRDRCVFARQDATRDPPFSNLDLISCRNVLIYLGPVLQKRILPFFHYALRDGGFLLLGTSESAGQVAELFSEVDRKQRIYARRSVPSRLVFDVGDGHYATATKDPQRLTSAISPREIDVFREADRALLARCAPPGVLVDENMKILRFRGNAGRFLTPAPGTPSTDLRSMARQGLLPDLAEALEESKLQNAPVRKEGLRIKSENGTIDAAVELIPVVVPPSSQRCFLVLFEEIVPAGRAAQAARRAAAVQAEPGDEQKRLIQLERELIAAKEYMRTSMQEREATDEELRAANEELLSSNEELQSTNEELQTAHEELQATNEELLTVNEELQHRNEEATLLGDDLANLLAGVEIPIIMLTKDFRIRRFTPSAGKLLSLIPADIDRQILDLKLKIDVPDLEELLVEVLDTITVQQREVQDRAGRWYSLSIRPYRSLADKIDGVVVTLNDVHAIKCSEQRFREARDLADSIVTSLRDPLLVLDRGLRVQRANQAFQKAFETVPVGVVASPVESAPAKRWYVSGLHQRLVSSLETGEAFESFEAETDFWGGDIRTVLLSARRVRSGEQDEPLILLAVEDVTERRLAERERAELAKQLEESQRLKALGVLAGGIAHDFNNILTAVVGYANLVQSKLPSDSPLLRHIDTIEQQALRAAELCNQMLAYSGQGRMVVRRLDLSAFVEELAPALSSSIGKGSVLQLELNEALPAIEADVAQLHQIVANLIINASESLGTNGSTITVKTGCLQTDPTYFATARIAPEVVQEQYVYLEVSDEGCGMDSETQAQIFDPFFSTKFAGRGLGLAAVIGSVRGHGGALSLDSEPGQGSVFRVCFPSVSGAIEGMPGPIPEDETWHGDGVVLIIDDETSVRESLREMLELLGFRVLEAENGREGLTVFSEKASEIALVMLDLTMPQLSGADTYPRLLELRPDLRIVLMSGYDEKESLEALGSTEVVGFLRKPFRYCDLVTKLRTIFDGE